MSKHTATPWAITEESRAEQQVVISGGADPTLGYDTWEGLAVCNGCMDDKDGGLEAARANAAHIVRCVNNFDALAEALDGLLRNSIAPEPRDGVCTPEEANFYDLAFRKARAALSAARGES